jgi:Right handed beta helix region
MKRREIPLTLLASALAGDSAPGKSPTLQYHPQTATELAAGVTPTNYAYPPQNALRYGADPSGNTDSTPAFRSLSHVIAQAQQGQLRTGRMPATVATIPEGSFRLTDPIRWRGPIAIVGAGTAGWEGGTTIFQTTQGRNIFEFYGSMDDHTTLGLSVRGISFGFTQQGGSGCALYIPKNDDTPQGSLLSSNSLYVEDCRFGGFNPYGSFLSVHHGNDIVVSRCLFDGCYGNTISLGDDTDPDARCTDVCIEGCGFFNTNYGVRIYNAEGVTITGCRFFHGSAAQYMIYLGAKAAINRDRVENVVICGNIFDDTHHSIALDGSVSQLQIAGNGFYKCRDRPILVIGRTDVSGLHLGPNIFKVDTAYPFSDIIDSRDCRISNSSVCDNLINCNGVRTLTQLAGETSGLGRFGQAMTLRANAFVNNPLYGFAGHHAYQPCTSRGLELENQLTFPNYPTAQPIFHVGKFEIGQSLTFDLDWEVIISKPSADTAALTGRDRISVIYRHSAGTVKVDVARISSVGDSTSGTRVNIPDVEFSVSTGPQTDVLITISGALKSPHSILINLKALNFRATATADGRPPQIKNAEIGFHAGS